jgi:hypothetical protein
MPIVIVKAGGRPKRRKEMAARLAGEPAKLSW